MQGDAETPNDWNDRGQSLAPLCAEHTKKASTEKQPTSRVVGIVKRNWRALDIRPRARQAPSLVGNKILVTIDRREITRYPDGHFVRTLGKAESKETEQENLLLEFEVSYRLFGKAILDWLPPEGEQWGVPH
ncbi:hypothetical protein F4604DRAFT_1675955 [Suillus subluteus]|nr:hypothetical protein F4604DRAFT_1675955 [Suillus subluteus]